MASLEVHGLSYIDNCREIPLWQTLLWLSSYCKTAKLPLAKILQSADFLSESLKILKTRGTGDFSPNARCRE
jgi:hypothetical protein